jgi:hypothetical protein
VRKPSDPTLSFRLCQKDGENDQLSHFYASLGRAKIHFHPRRPRKRSTGRIELSLKREK